MKIKKILISMAIAIMVFIQPEGHFPGADIPAAGG